uniref:Uncharacterized protein n=1 Tax=Globisporangium ultimum (strain ATCC 200006 / CBS 805.95 / DAOM BR144) TaxID=431595 RepID=K3W8N9_GLOUD
MKHELYLKEQEAVQKKLAESIADNLQKQKTKKEAQYMQLWKEVEDGKALAAELHEKLQLQEQSKSRQIQRMHDEWTTGVFQKLNEPVLNKVQAMDSKELSLSKHETYQRFLDITNKKGGLFRDIIIESEYNPLNDVKYLSNRSKIDDPVKRVIRRCEEENAIARDGANLSRESHDSALSDSSTYRPGKDLIGRGDNLDVKLWSKGVYESTPYGYFHKMMSSTANAESSKTYASRVKLDHYNVDTGPEVVQQELPRGKRTNFDGCAIVPKTTIQLT